MCLYAEKVKKIKKKCYTYNEIIVTTDLFDRSLSTEVKKKIGIKYCGGCNPGYERVEMMERVQFRFNDRFFFLPHDEPDIDALILMSGCHRACAGENLNTTKIPHYPVTGEDDFNSLISWLKSLRPRGDF